MAFLRVIAGAVYHNVTSLTAMHSTNTSSLIATQLFKPFGDGSTERAWRITGDYGTGKSCFALALARICDRKVARLPWDLRLWHSQSGAGSLVR
jgi:hypothetical protein